jgi:hypothetical protein
VSFIKLDVHVVNQVFGFFIYFGVLLFERLASLVLLLGANVEDVVD